MKRQVIKGISLLSVLTITLCGCGAVVEPAAGKEAAEKKIYVAGSEMTFDIRPQDDFYGYINAADLWNMEVAYGEGSAGTFDQVMELVDGELDKIIGELAAKRDAYEKGTCERLVADYYNLCKSGSRTDRKIFDEAFALIDGAGTTEEFTSVLGRLVREYGCEFFVFNFEIIRNPRQPDKYCLAVSESEVVGGDLKEIYEKDSGAVAFRDGLADLMTGYGTDYDTAYDKADAITYLWLDIAGETDFKKMEQMEKCDDPYTLEELQNLVSNADIKKLMLDVGILESDLERLDAIYVYDAAQLAKVNRLYTAEYLETWKDYAKCAFLQNFQDYLPPEYNHGEEPDTEVSDKMLLEQVKKFCYRELDPLYKERCFTAEKQSYMARMEADIRDAYVKMIKKADWLSLEARDLMVEKFNNIEFYFGGEENPGHKTDRAGVLADNLLRTNISATTQKLREHIEKLHQKPDNSKWDMGAQEVNAYYNPSANAIYITTAIMNAPFFDKDRDYYSNLGGLGAVICHELSHAFDVNGIKYDAKGSYNPEWIPEADDAAFQEKVAVVDAHYDKYALLEVYHVDGEKTVGENLADIGGIQCILSMAKTKQDYEHIFESYAKIWCTLYQNKNLIMYLENDVHSPDIVRVNAPLSCFDEFYETYGVKEGDGMYVEPQERVKRW